MSLELPALLAAAASIAAAASAEILRLRASATSPDSKRDGTPVTAADDAADALIVAALGELTPDVPVISEESVEAGRIPSVAGGVFWLVDPLDGTREFVAGRPDFTVNIGLVRDADPVLGVIAVPMTGEVFTGAAGCPATLRQGSEPGRAIRCRPAPAGGLTLVASRSHDSAGAVARLLARWRVSETRQIGSARKFCLLAAGEADVYARLGATMEWDTAAGHALLNAAGGRLVNHDGTPFRYGKPGFLNPGFLAVADPAGAAGAGLLPP